MDQVRFTTAEMKGVETQLLERRDQSFHRERATGPSRTLVCLLFLAVVLLTAFYLFIRHDLAERRRNDRGAPRQRGKSARRHGQRARRDPDHGSKKASSRWSNLQAKTLFGYSRTEISRPQPLDPCWLAGRYARRGRGGKLIRVGRLAGDNALREMRSVAARFDGVRKDGTSFPLDLSRSPVDHGR